ncbi:interferon-induced protein 44-like [Mercenaria mercenaria]|uniref:interferon-induced protein 44-like n=1 Tax=Mercenaria mercenaria TaxID=6596 RepID=UPI00234E8AB6|nr:interferon-induced protein 44-like [Mercenaria mercenaria]
MRLSKFQQFNPVNAIKENDTYYRQNPTMADKIHCAVFVMRVDKLDNLLPAYEKKLRQLLTDTLNKDVPRILLLTRCDIVCEDVAKNVGNLYKSVKVKKKVEQASALFGIPISNIHPIVNYGEGQIEKEYTECDRQMFRREKDKHRFETQEAEKIRSFELMQADKKMLNKHERLKEDRVLKKKELGLLKIKSESEI